MRPVNAPMASSRRPATKSAGGTSRRDSNEGAEGAGEPDALKIWSSGAVRMFCGERLTIARYEPSCRRRPGTADASSSFRSIDTRSDVRCASLSVRGPSMRCGSSLRAAVTRRQYATGVPTVKAYWSAPRCTTIHVVARYRGRFTSFVPHGQFCFGTSGTQTVASLMDEEAMK